MRTPLERMNMAYAIAKKWITEQGQHLEEIDLQDKAQSAILSFVVIRDYPFLESWEVDAVKHGIKTIVELAVAEKRFNNEEQQQERKQHVFN